MTDAKRTKRAPIQATVSDTRPEMAHAKKRGPYIQDKALKAAFVNLVRQGLPVYAVRKRLQEDFPDSRLPSDRTIERWTADYQKARGDVQWQWTGKDMDNWLLEAQTAVLLFTEGQVSITEREAEALRTVHDVAPKMPPLTAWFFCQEIVASPKGQDLGHIINSLGFARLPSAKDGLSPQTIEAHVVSHLRRWPDRPLIAWTPNEDVANLYKDSLDRHISQEYMNTRQPIGFIELRRLEDGQCTWLTVTRENLSIYFPPALEKAPRAPRTKESEEKLDKAVEEAVKEAEEEYKASGGVLGVGGKGGPVTVTMRTDKIPPKKGDTK